MQATRRGGEWSVSPPEQDRGALFPRCGQSVQQKTQDVGGGRRKRLALMRPSPRASTSRLAVNLIFPTTWWPRRCSCWTRRGRSSSRATTAATSPCRLPRSLSRGFRKVCMRARSPRGTRGHRCAAVAGCARRACAPRPRSALSFPPTADRCRLGASRASWAAVRAGRGRRWACDERLFFSPRRHPVSRPRAAPRCPDLDTFRSLFCAMRCNFPCARVLCAQCACLFPRDCTAAAFRRSANADEPLLRPPRACR